jgi:Ca2+/Na+ antiporter
MMNVFSVLSVPQLSRLARRTALAAAGMGAAALIVTVVVGGVLFGVGVCLGLAMALVNFRLIARATAKASASAREDKRRPLVTNTLGRLGLISVVALLLAWLVRPLGFGAIVGLAVFQFTLLANVLVTLLRDPSMRAVGGSEP